MGIESAATVSTSSVSSVSSGSKSSGVSSNNSSETSFKDEMSKVSETEKKDNKSEEKIQTDKTDDKVEVSNSEIEKDKLTEGKNTFKELAENEFSDCNLINGSISINNMLSLNDANDMLTSNIQQMMQNVISPKNLSVNWGVSIGSSSPFNLSMNESDANFFMNLTQNQDVSLSGISVQAQNMIDSGSNVQEVKQNVQVSQTLLNALSESMQKSQPIRVDFDQNISVILRVGRDGTLAAHFIPGDKAVEQYLKSNLETLKSTLREQDLPYSELSYSNSSKQQNERRRNKQQQGE